MPDVRTLHREAMEASDYAFYYRRKGHHRTASQFFWMAWQLEQQALNMTTKEPTRSVLQESAGWLHWNYEMSRVCKIYCAVEV